MAYTDIELGDLDVLPASRPALLEKSLDPRPETYVKRIRRKGIDTLREAAAILYLILRNYRRGWTYEQGSCRKIKMTNKLFGKRVRFVKRLARLHGADPATQRAVAELVDYVLKHRRLPSRLRVGGRTGDPRRLAEEALARKR